MQSGLISILIPFKNTEAFLGECLDSILKQTYTNWEVVAVDDDSADSSLELVSQYGKKDTRIKVLKNSGKGIIPALQKAYTNCNGQFVTRMDSDDIMTPNRLEWMVNALTKNGQGHLAVGQVTYFSEKGISDGYARYEKWLNSLTEKGSNYSEIYKECVVPSPCWMVFRSDFEQCGGFDINRYPEDYDLAFRFYENRLKVLPCNEILHKWRDYDHRASRTSEHYAQNYFLDIKLHYFLKLDYKSNRQLVLWGAGYKGKEVVKKLMEKRIDFVWLCDNPKKIGTKIYNQPLFHFSELSSLDNPQSIITVANMHEQKEITSFLNELGHAQGKDYFFFC
ncbi:glycosyltransferase family 2 protein [Flagellimonas meridianipacifica]|uniref:Glycosyltransferase involved in cell wall biosynthesis n=1 Tax=Flagellimonas meridianipacifica TaxID=1080225 RepID=A0A2T0MC81_9FLAO|nr:glycosyltransferase family 2 protein [Allomuricauda pacifica]PRX55111.1 glycosyltransferase involved in cell wall biosynthesis [Allomuricauda pacifica]